jgi:hypothetical protein
MSICGVSNLAKHPASAVVDYRTESTRMIATFKGMPETSRFGPSIVQIATDGPAEGLVMAWTGEDGAGTLNSSYSNTGGTVWNKTIIHNETSVAAPALVQRDGILYMAWAGTNPAHNLNVMSSTDRGAHWGHLDGPLQALPGRARPWKHSIPNEGSDFAPALIWYLGRLVLSWTDRNGTVCLAHSQDEGKTWSKVTLPEQSIAGPSLAAYASGAGFSHLFIAWTGTDHRLNLRSVEGANFDAFAAPNQGSAIADTSAQGPSLAVLNEGEGKDIFLAMAYSSNDGDRKIHVIYSLQGFSPFGNGSTADDSSEGTPAMFTHRDFPAQNDELVFAWAGTDGEGHLNLCPAGKLF